MESICCPWQKAQSCCCKSCRCKENSYPGCACFQQAFSGAQKITFISCVFVEQRKTLLVSLVVAKFFNQKNTACIIGRFDQKNSACIIGRSFQARNLSCTSACWWTSNLDPVQRKSWLVSLIFEDNFDCSQFSGLSAHWRIASLPVTAPPGSFWGYFIVTKEDATLIWKEIWAVSRRPQIFRSELLLDRGNHDRKWKKCEKYHLRLAPSPLLLALDDGDERDEATVGKIVFYYLTLAYLHFIYLHEPFVYLACTILTTVYYLWQNLGRGRCKLSHSLTCSAPELR